MNQAREYLERFRQAKTVDQQQGAAEAYQSFYGTLPADEQKRADEVMSVLWPEIDDEVAELERLSHQAKQRLSNRAVQA